MDCNDAVDFIPDLDNWTQRFKENPSDPLEDIRSEHEAFLTDLEAAAVKALGTGDWSDVESCIYFYNPQTRSYDV